MEKVANGKQIEEMNLFEKLYEVRKRCDYLKKQSGKIHAYNPSSQVIGLVRPLLDEYGIYLYSKVTDVKMDTILNEVHEASSVKRKGTFMTQLWIEYTWINVHNTSETLCIPWYAQGLAHGDEKGPGKAYTYAEKTFFLREFNIATDNEDPDVYGQGRTEYVSYEQAKQLAQIAGAIGEIRGVSADSYRQQLQINSWERIPADQFGSFYNKLNNWLEAATDKKKQKEQKEKKEQKDQAQIVAENPVVQEGSKKEKTSVKNETAPMKDEVKEKAAEKAKVSEGSKTDKEKPYQSKVDANVKADNEKETKPEVKSSENTSKSKSVKESNSNEKAELTEVTIQDISLDVSPRGQRYAKLILNNTSTKEPIGALAKGDELLDFLDQIEAAPFYAKLTQEGQFFLVTEVEKKEAV